MGGDRYRGRWIPENTDKYWHFLGKNTDILNKIRIFYHFPHLFSAIDITYRIKKAPNIISNFKIHFIMKFKKNTKHLDKNYKIRVLVIEISF